MGVYLDLVKEELSKVEKLEEGVPAPDKQHAILHKKITNEWDKQKNGSYHHPKSGNKATIKKNGDIHITTLDGTKNVHKSPKV